MHLSTVYPKKYAHDFCFAVLCCGYTLTDFPISIRLPSLALWQSNDCPSASKATLMNMDKYFMWIQYERMHNHNKAKHNKTVCIFLGIYCTSAGTLLGLRSNNTFQETLALRKVRNLMYLSGLWHIVDTRLQNTCFLCKQIVLIYPNDQRLFALNFHYNTIVVNVMDVVNRSPTGSFGRKINAILEMYVFVRT